MKKGRGQGNKSTGKEEVERTWNEEEEGIKEGVKERGRKREINIKKE